MLLRHLILLLAAVNRGFSQQEDPRDFWSRLYEDPRNHRFLSSLLNDRRTKEYDGRASLDTPEAIINLLADQGKYSAGFLKSATEYLETLSGNVVSRSSGRRHGSSSHTGASISRELVSRLSGSPSWFPLVSVESGQDDLPTQSSSASNEHVSTEKNIPTRPSPSRPVRNPVNSFPLVHAPGYRKNYSDSNAYAPPIVSAPVPVASGGVIPPDNYFNEDHLVTVDNIPLEISDPAFAPPSPGSGSSLSTENGSPFSVVDGVNDFTLGLLATFEKGPGNVVFSPISITCLLSLLTLATNGQTKHEIETALSIPNIPTNYQLHIQYKNILERLNQVSRGINIQISTKLFVANNLNIHRSYTDKSVAYYNSTTDREDFLNRPDATLKRINKWVEKTTEGKIKDFLSKPLHPASKLVAVSTMYFKGDWKFPFEKEFTMKRNFNTGTDIIPIPMMVGIINVPYYFSRELNLHIVSLPYVGDEFSMVILLPREDPSHRSIESVESELNNSIINNLLNSMKTERISFTMPRMRLRMKRSLVNNMNLLNVTQLFSDGSDFSGLTPSTVRVNDFLHEALLEVTEEGTVGAAASSVMMNRNGGSTVVRVDRPAILFIRDNLSGLPLFWARLVRPETL